MTRLHQAGFTLIELMVAITLGLLITAAAIQLYLTSPVSPVLMCKKPCRIFKTVPVLG